MPNHYKVVYCFFYDSSYGFECMRERKRGRREKEREREGGERESLYHTVGHWLCNFTYSLCKLV